MTRKCRSSTNRTLRRRWQRKGVAMLTFYFTLPCILDRYLILFNFYLHIWNIIIMILGSDERSTFSSFSKIDCSKLTNPSGTWPHSSWDGHLSWDNSCTPSLLPPSALSWDSIKEFLYGWDRHCRNILYKDEHLPSGNQSNTIWSSLSWKIWESSNRSRVRIMR